MVLVAGALLAAGLAGVAGRRAPAGPEPRAVPRRRDGGRARTASAGSTSPTTSWRDVGIIALALILFEGGLRRAGTRSGRCSGRRSAWRRSGRSITAVIAGLGAAWLFDLSPLEGLLIGAIVAATDGAAIFARAARLDAAAPARAHAGGRGGHERPVAVLLVHRLHRLDRAAGLRRRCDMLLAVRRASCRSALAVGHRGRLRSAVRALRQRARSRPPACTRWRRWRSRRWRSAARTSLHGSGFLAVYLAGLALGSGPIPARRTISTFHDGLAWVAQIGDVPRRSGLLVFPASSATVALEGTALALVARVRRAADGHVRRDVGVRLLGRTSSVALGWAGPARRRAGGARDLPGDRGRPARPRVLQHRVLRRARLDGAAGHDVRARSRRGSASRRTSRRCRGRWSRPARSARLGAEVVEFPVRAGRRDRRAPRARARPAARGAGQRDRPRRAGDPAARLDAHRGGRPPARARPPGGRASSSATCSRAGATGPIGAAARPRAPRPRTPPDLHEPAVERGDGDPGRPTAVDGVEVVEQLRTRRDQPGALVALADGRYAFTGPAASPSARRRRCRTSRGAGCSARRTTPSARGGARSSARSRCPECADMRRRATVSPCASSCSRPCSPPSWSHPHPVRGPSGRRRPRPRRSSARPARAGCPAAGRRSAASCSSSRSTPTATATCTWSSWDATASRHRVHGRRRPPRAAAAPRPEGGPARRPPPARSSAELRATSDRCR